MKILMLAPFVDREKKGGTSGHVFSLSKALACQTGVSVTLMCFGLTDSVEEASGLRVITLSKKRWHRLMPLAPMLQIRRIVQRERPDIVHVQGSVMSYPLLYSILLSSRRIKKLITIHGHPIEEGLLEGWLKKGSLRHQVALWSERRIPGSFDAIVSVATSIQNGLTEKYPAFRKAELYVIPNGVNPEEFSPTSPKLDVRLFGISNDKDAFTILNSKALIESNGQEFLIRAFGQIADEIEGSRLILIGDGPEMPRLKKITIDLKLENRVFFLGEIANSLISQALAIADVVVIPSLRIEGVEEGSSLSLLEAMASSRPVIASNIGGMSEEISDGVTGLLVPDRDHIAIAGMILYLFENKDVALRIGRHSREWILKERTWIHIAQRYLQVYAYLIDEEPDFAPPPQDEINHTHRIPISSSNQSSHWIQDSLVSREG